MNYRKIRNKKNVKKKKPFYRQPSIIISGISALLGFVTFLFIYITYESPAQIECELYLVQRPDSIYQAQIHLWNDGDVTAEKIIIRSKIRNAFLTDSSKTKTKLNLWLFPIFEGGCLITPNRILSHLGKEREFPNYKIEIPYLQNSTKYDNYFIVMPQIVGKKNWNSVKYSLFRSKFVDIDKNNFDQEFIKDIENNLSIQWQGKYLKFPLVKIIDIDAAKEIGIDYFPRRKDLPKRSGTEDPEYFRPKFIIKKIKRGYGGYGGW